MVSEEDATATVNAVYDTSTKKATISWEPTKTNSTYYKVYIQTQIGDNWVNVSNTPIAQQTQKQYVYNMAYSDLGVYRFVVDEYVSSSASSALASQHSKSIELLPEKPNLAPENLTVTADSSGVYVVKFSKPSGLTNADIYSIEGSKDGKTWSELETGDADASAPTYGISIGSAYKDKLNLTLKATNYFRVCYKSSDGVAGPYSKIVSCEYQNFSVENQQSREAADAIEKAKPTSSAAGGYSITEQTKPGMAKIFDHQMYNLKVEFVSSSSRWNYNSSTGAATLKYTFTPKYNGLYSVDFPELGINDHTEWTDSSGNKVVFNCSTKEVKANVAYTCTQSCSGGAGFHTANVEVGTMNVDVGDGVLISTTYFWNEFEYCIAPSVMSLDVAMNAESDRSSITVKDLDGEGAITIFYKAKKDKNWKSVSTSAHAKKKIGGLKADTEYQVKMQTVYSAKNSAGNYVKLASPESNVITFKTGLKTKPTIKSVKITKGKYKKVYTKGYWTLSYH